MLMASAPGLCKWRNEALPNTVTIRSYHDVRGKSGLALWTKDGVSALARLCFEQQCIPPPLHVFTASLSALGVFGQSAPSGGGISKESCVCSKEL